MSGERDSISVGMVQGFRDTFRRLERREQAFFSAESYDVQSEEDMQNGDPERAERITRHLHQSSSEQGIYGVSVGEFDLPILTVLGTYYNPVIRAEIGERNFQEEDEKKRQTFFDATAEIHGIPIDAVKASVDYYNSHREDIDAYFRYQRALQRRDPLVNGNQPPQQLPLPQTRR